MLLLTLGCGSLNKKKDNQQPPADDRALFEQYFLEDTACQTGDESTQLKSYRSQIWEGGKISSEIRTDAENIYSKYSLTSSSTLVTWQGLMQTESCQLESGRLVCDPTKNNVLFESSPLRVCNENSDFQRSSIEGIALTSITHLDVALKFYRKTPGSRSDLGRTGLLVLPKLEKKFQVERNGEQIEESYIVSDNLAYVAAYRGIPTFVVYPSSSQASSPNQPNLWESPWIIAHEYGHHVFRVHTETISTYFNNQGSSSLRLHSDVASNLTADPHFPSKQRQSQKPSSDLGLSLLQQRSVGAKQHWKVVDEAFADLYAFYSLGAQPALVQKIPCMEVSRDVLSNKFSDGQTKVLDSSHLGTFLSAQLEEASENCAKPDWQGEHAVGAAVAYGVNQLFQNSVDVQQGRKSEAQILLTWADQIKVLVKQEGSSLDIQKMVYLAATAAATVANGSYQLTVNQCLGMKKVFPVWSNDWLGQSPKFRCLN